MDLSLEKLEENSGYMSGFPNPAQSAERQILSLDALLVQHPDATFFVRVKGENYTDLGISNEDILLVDRAIMPSQNSLVVCFPDNEFTLRRLKVENGKFILCSSKKSSREVVVNEVNRDIFWGVVRYVIKKV